MAYVAQYNIINLCFVDVFFMNSQLLFRGCDILRVKF